MIPSDMGGLADAVSCKVCGNPTDRKTGSLCVRPRTNTLRASFT
jgi:hypothetical protein